MAINRIKYVDVNSQDEESDFVRFTPSGAILETLSVTVNGSYYCPPNIDGWNVVNVNVPESTFETITITENGTYTPTADGYSSVTVDVFCPEYYLERILSNDGTLNLSTNVMDFTGIKDIGRYGLAFAYYNSSSITSGPITFPDLEKVTGYRAMQSMFNTSNKVTSLNMPKITEISGDGSCESSFAFCSNLTSINLPNLERIGRFVSRFDRSFTSCTSMFTYCNITSISLPKLNTISVNCAVTMFSNCRSLVSADLRNLKTLIGHASDPSQGCCSQMFSGDTLLEEVNLSSLEEVWGGNCCAMMFQNCTALTSLSFPAIKTTSFTQEGDEYPQTNQFKDMCKNIPNITLHFPSNVQSVIEGLDGYSTIAPFGAISGTVLFDLPETE